MINTIKKCTNKILQKRSQRFILTGILTVIIDLLIYSLLINLGFLINLSKGISFLLGALFSFFVNKSWTFKAKGDLIIFLKFITIYIISLIINVRVNDFIINLFDNNQNLGNIMISFILSTFLSANFNFFGLSIIVFTKKKYK